MAFAMPSRYVCSSAKRHSKSSVRSQVARPSRSGQSRHRSPPASGPAAEAWCTMAEAPAGRGNRIPAGASSLPRFRRLASGRRSPRRPPLGRRTRTRWRSWATGRTSACFPKAAPWPSTPGRRPPELAQISALVGWLGDTFGLRQRSWSRVAGRGAGRM
jgi:hypothetical protein